MPNYPIHEIIDEIRKADPDCLLIYILGKHWDKWIMVGLAVGYLGFVYFAVQFLGGR